MIGSKQKGKVLGMMALMMLLCLTAAAASADSTSFGVIYNSPTLNLRSQPSSSGAWLGTYNEGDWVQIIGESGGWHYVTTMDGKVGYMSKSYIEVAPEAMGTIGIVNNPKATSFLNLRTGPSYVDKVAGIYYNGVPCRVFSESNGWVHVMVNGTDGYFRREYLTIKNLIYGEEVATVVTPNMGNLNMRTGPASTYSTLRQLKGGSYVMVLQSGKGWAKVTTDNCVGFVDTKYLQSGVLTPGDAQKRSIELFGGSPVKPTPGPFSNAYAVVTNPKATQVLNLRESASTTSRSLAQYKNGARLTMLDQGTEWCKVQTTDGLVGYMMSKYLTLYNLPATPTKTVTHPDKTFVNLRTLGSSYATIITRVPHGTSVTIIVPGDKWAKVKFNGTVGYMSTYFLK